ncbi:hypothetical protein R1sor_001179 [Riccia sorocarpa]|uniref:Homeobox domain-containing protein n=1 Tax=Riccia sorocarpa TaxID=122646 RepID=A0ABD3GXM7_9MARC
MDPRRIYSVGSSGSSSNNNTRAGSYQLGQQQLQSVFKQDLAAAACTAAAVSASNSFVTQDPEFRLPHWTGYSSAEGISGYVDCTPTSTENEEFKNINESGGVNEQYSDFFPRYNEVVSEEISGTGYSGAGYSGGEGSFSANGTFIHEQGLSGAGYSGGEGSFSANGTFIHEQGLGYLSAEAFGETQSVSFDLPTDTSGMDLDFSGYQSENLIDEFWPSYAFTTNLHDLEELKSSSRTGVEFQPEYTPSNSNLETVDQPQTQGEIWNSNQSELQTEFQPKPLLMFDPIPMTEAEINSFYALSGPQPLLELEPSFGSEGSSGSCQVDGIGNDTQSLVDSLTESFHDLEMKESSKNNWVVRNTISTSQSFDLETQMRMDEVMSKHNPKHVLLSVPALRQDPYDGSSNSVLSTCTASTNESRVGPRENVGSLADGDINWSHEKDIIISRMLGKRDATQLPEDVKQEVMDILQDFEKYWKRDVSNVNFKPIQERSLRCFQRTITLTLNAYCERERRRVRYLPDFCKHALSDWVSTEPHQQNPYPEKSMIRSLANELGLTCTQVEQWFENYRVRTWKPTQTGIRKGKFFRYPAERTAILKRWILDHKNDPKPQGKELKDLIESTGMTNAQVKQWCYNYRRRHKRDMQG